MIERIGLVIVLGIVHFMLLRWWKDPLRRCRACDSRLTMKYLTTSGPDREMEDLWRVHHNVYCFRCKAETVHTVLTGKPPDWLVMAFRRSVDREL